MSSEPLTFVTILRKKNTIQNEKTEYLTMVKGLVANDFHNFYLLQTFDSLLFCFSFCDPALYLVNKTN